jgi:hypothetical protein
MQGSRFHTVSMARGTITAVMDFRTLRTGARDSESIDAFNGGVERIADAAFGDDEAGL